MTNAAAKTSISRLGQFILVRLLAAGKKPASRTDVDRALKRFFADRLGLTGSAWRDLLTNTFGELYLDGLIETRPLRLTESGRSESMHFLGADSLPAGIQWRTIRNRYILAKALGVQPNTSAAWVRLGTSEGVRAAVLVRTYQLPIEAVPTISKAMHALAWIQMRTAHASRLPFDKDFTRDNVLQSVLMSGQSGKPAERLPSIAAGATNNRPDSVREAVIRSWLDEQDKGETKTDVVNRFDLRRFAERVKEIARTSKQGRFGENKVFISYVWDRFKDDAESNGMSHDEFSERLTAANRDNLLALSRADLVGAMDPKDVAASEIRLEHSTFHFIRIDH